MKHWLTLFLVIVLSSSTYFLFKLAGMGISPGYFHPVLNIWFIAGMGIQGVIFILWQLLLRQYPVSSLYPFLALTYVIVPVGAYVFFQEPFGLRYIVGACLIMLGIVFISVGAKNA